MKNSLVILREQDLPEQIKEWRGHPEAIWCAGDESLFLLPLVSVIGSRNASREGLARTRRMTQLLVRSGVVVVSGLAEGVDAAAHIEALRSGGKTVAVMGTPIDGCYPAKHRELKEQIIHKGLVISQFPPGHPTARKNFPQRNQLMAALSFMTLVMEAGPASGTRHQVFGALKLGRRVGFLASLSSKGIPWIRDALLDPHAFVVAQPDDILKELDSLSAFFPTLQVEVPKRTTGGPSSLESIPLDIQPAGPITNLEAAEPKTVSDSVSGNDANLPAPSKLGIVSKILVALWQFVSRLWK